MKRNFEPSDKGLKCFIEQHGITLKINKGKTKPLTVLNLWEEYVE